ncbi:hypothetical protein [Collinsella ihumii]|uniref:Glycosyltransferase family 1 protein n=1 Tax=Collinsella ihumii TaxID=1720204 RepID=A0AAW7JQD0_9ACTN|nr:hypothetical protein [Collinsella ihumii]MDN0069544.1 hypothetical protein [Collinsella ihumii]
MKVGIIGVGDIRHMTMISFFTEIFNKNNINHEIICINRYNGKQNFFQCPIFEFQAPNLQDKSKIRKFRSFIAFRKYAIKLVKDRQYDFLIIWNENTALLFADFLIQYYTKRYCICIRDLTFKRRGPISRIREAAIRDSAFSTLVAPIAFDYPKGYSYYPMISENRQIIQKCCVRKQFTSKARPIRISYIGNVRFYKNDFEIIQLFANDNRFVIQFFGHGAYRYKKWIEKYNIKNIILEDVFLPDETPKYLEKTDILNCYYGHTIPYWKYYLPIKFGYAAPLRIPAIVSSGSLLGSLAEEYQFSFKISSIDSCVADDLWNWYHTMSFSQFEIRCKKYTEYVAHTNKKLETKIMSTLDECNYKIEGK